MQISAVLLLVFLRRLVGISAEDVVSITATPSTTTHFYLQPEKGRNSDSSSATTIGAAAKSSDPPPEFYRGPGSTAHHFTSTAQPFYYNHNYKPYDSPKSRPIAFPQTYGSNGNGNDNDYNKYSGGGAGAQGNRNGHAASSYNSWQHLKGKGGLLWNKQDDLLLDRISVGPYGLSGHETTTSGGYAHDSRPYAASTHHVDYLSTNQHYGSSAAPTAHTNAYYGGSAATAEGIPFDVYGSKNHYSSLGGNDYAPYSYSETLDPAAHKAHPDISQKVLLAKSFLIPLASAAVLGIAAALVSNPLLLQLGTVSGISPGTAILGKRKRRDLTTSATFSESSRQSWNSTLNSTQQSETNSQLHPYRGLLNH